MSLGLKLYYLRTRVKKVTQTTMAKELRIRQATISNIEQGLSQPSLPLLRAFCRYFDVTPTYLLDEDGQIELGPAERWSHRHGLATAGNFLEVRKNAVQPIDDSDTLLVAMLPGTPVYDEEAARKRATSSTGELKQAFHDELDERRSREAELRRELENERRASRLRRRGAANLATSGRASESA
ncbi:MAG: helix-turn-helix transcriptional regulator [Planctomycetes bacterium]|nr:helix-turn-helix transcriptional regulator [Planctomycetota bacterium]